MERMGPHPRWSEGTGEQLKPTNCPHCVHLRHRRWKPCSLHGHTILDCPDLEVESIIHHPVPVKGLDLNRFLDRVYAPAGRRAIEG